MLDDFKRALVRVQTDYDFYVACQTDPAVALVDYDLTPDERATLTDPDQLADLLIRGADAKKALPSITVTISGKHDWINVAEPKKPTDSADHDARVAAEVEAIRQAGTDDERTGATVRLMGLIG